MVTLRSAFAICILPSLLLMSCVQRRPRDLRLEQVYVADLSNAPGYKREAAMGMRKRPLRLAIVLSTSEIFSLGASVVDGFCGTTQGPGYLGNGTLYRAVDATATDTLSQHDRHRYLVLVDIEYKSQAPSAELANFDLREDNRDICLTTGAGTYSDVWQSNEVRVPRSLIEEALRAPPHADVPLAPDQIP